MHSTVRAGQRLLVAGVIALAMPIAGWAQAPTVSSTGGMLQGTVVDGISVFRGVPYAAPPVGDLRWREPQPVQPWPAVRDASAAGPSCPQKRGLSLEGGGDPGVLDEDCLYLYVYTPRADPDARRPVMVWIHGGALIFGGGALPS